MTAVVLSRGRVRSGQGDFHELGVCVCLPSTSTEGGMTRFSKTRDGSFLVTFPLRNGRS